MPLIVLIVEDCAESVPALEIALQKYFRCEVEHHGTGREALAAFHRRPESMLAIITDLNLPDMDGWDIIRQVRGHAAGASLPAIAISADPKPQARAQALEAGANAFFGKPYSPLEVCRCLEGILDAKETLDLSTVHNGESVRSRKNARADGTAVDGGDQPA